ncbi:MAG TPA: TraR/DksA family transcriptional regulator [Candidatus Binatia bacterium]|nr:TraR/DksA family transcriptional regulator [Candidatus Binatia bacterium]
MTIEDIRHRLLERRRSLLRQVASMEDDLRFLDTNQNPELEEESQEQNIARLLAQLDDRSTAEIQRIDGTIARIDAGDYGRCEECDEPIPLERLEALPTATTCVLCAEVRERAAERVPA